MSTTAAPRTRPLVAVLYDVPLFAESLEGVFEGVAELHPFAAHSNPIGLLRWVQPDAIVVEGVDVVESVRAFAEAASVPIVHVQLRGAPGILVAGAAHVREDADVSPHSIRDAVLGALLERSRV